VRSRIPTDLVGVNFVGWPSAQEPVAVWGGSLVLKLTMQPLNPHPGVLVFHPRCRTPELSRGRGFEGQTLELGSSQRTAATVVAHDSLPTTYELCVKKVCMSNTIGGLSILAQQGHLFRLVVLDSKFGCGAARVVNFP
jgi:hypothetical protein